MNEPRPPSWKWTVCGLLLLATMLNYMDRQTLAQLAPIITKEYDLNNEHYGNLEMGFGLAFAAGALFFGFLVDRFSALWLYPLVLVGWSLAGVITAYADFIGSTLLEWFPSFARSGSESEAAYVGFMACRIVLGFFEAGHWPCALVTTQTILSRRDRSFGNSILQSGAAIGAIITPLIILTMVRDVPGVSPVPGSWRPPFVVIGFLGLLWVVGWLAVVRRRDLVRLEDNESSALPAEERATDAPPTSFWRPFIVLIIVVVMINMTWQFYRAWLPMFLQKHHGYSLTQVSFFSSVYYIATDVGCITAGFVVKWLGSRGWGVHTPRMLTFGVCALLTLFSVLVGFLPSGPLLLGLLLLIGAGALGLFPNYYSFTQELSTMHQGKIVGILGALTWVATSIMHPQAGKNIDATGSYTNVFIVAGLAPIVAFAALWLLWEKKPGRGETTR